MKEWDFYNKQHARFGEYDLTPMDKNFQLNPEDAESVFMELITDVSDPDQMLLDLGCGDGKFTFSLRSM